MSAQSGKRGVGRVGEHGKQDVVFVGLSGLVLLVFQVMR